MLNFFYNLIIYPLILIIEFFFSFFRETVGNMGLVLIGLSFIVTLFTLPLYMIAESWQEVERNKQLQLKPGIDRIKAVFKGDEQYMILTTFYRQNHYHPMMALRSSFGIMIQIPFFLAAYKFLSTLEPLNGCSFFFIKNLGEQDAVFKIGNFNVNILPIAMTLINCISGFFYSKGHPVSEKIQIYGCAALFLVLLYSSPSGLVLYWTMNNILSLVKNIFYKLKNPKKVLYILSCIIAALFIFAGIFVLKSNEFFRLVAVAFGVLIPFIPFIIRLLGKFFNSNFTSLDSDTKTRTTLFILSAFSIAVLCGLVIPSTLMESEPENFCYIDFYQSPFIFLRTAFAQALGIFVFWPSCFFFLFGAKTKKVMSCLYPVILIIALINTFAFSGNYGPIENTLLFMTDQKYAPTLFEFILNSILIIFVLSIGLFAANRKPKFLNYIPLFILIAFTGLTLKNSITIKAAFSKMEPVETKEEVDPIYHLSKTGKNVIVVMQDRLFNPYVPYSLQERPDLIEKFDGFTFYYNTISMAPMTLLGTPGIYGGYDYTPFEMNLVTDKTIQQKQNEAILTMPIVFHDAGFSTTISDVPYENYNEQPVTDMYKDYPYINRIKTESVYSPTWYKRHNLPMPNTLSKRIKRNFICFSIFKIVPPIARRFVYHNEYWVSNEKLDKREQFVKGYSVLEFLPELVDSNGNQDCFVLLNNTATHEPFFLQAPDFEPAEVVTDYGTCKFSDDPQYHVIIGTLLVYTKFFEYLKKEGVYDNTRIILVSDHGQHTNVGDIENIREWPFVKENYTASIFIKDFNAHGNLVTDMTFMTNADTPYLATKDIIDNPENPFSKKPFYRENKEDYVKLFTAPAISTRNRKSHTLPISDNEWYTVKENIFLDKNWDQYKPESK